MESPAGLASSPIERRAGITREEFVRSYLEPRRPVILTGLMDGWAATQRWTQDYFLAKYGDARPPVLLQRHQSELPPEDETASTRSRAGVRRGVRSRQFERRPMPLRDLIATFRKGEWEDPKRPPYLWWAVFDEHPELLDELGPLDFYPNWLAWRAKLSDRFYGWRALLLSPASATYNLHFDEMGVHGVIMQFQGRKRFVLYPPDQAQALYDGRVDPDVPDFEAFPRFREARGRLEGIVHPGEMIFQPCYWWHQVTTLEHSVSVVVHSVNRNNVTDVLGEIAVKRARMFREALASRFPSVRSAGV